MKILSPAQSRSNAKKENEELIEKNIRLRKLYTGILSKLKLAKDDYSSEKLQKLREFDVFVQGLNEKKSKLLKELKDIMDQIDAKKEVYYGLIAKQDELDEKIYTIKERETKLDLREDFIKQLEEKLNLNG